MDFHLACACGREVVVTAAQAGTEVVCQCGKEVWIPSLSKLRELSGRGAYEAGTVDTINRMFNERELPWGNVCEISGEPTRDVLHICVQVERIYRPQDHTILALLGVLVSPILLLGLFQKQRPEVGRETVVHTPLRVSRQYHASLEGASQRRLLRLLRQVPIYAKLLDEYPRSRVCVGTLEDCTGHAWRANRMA
jgi:hypothetical protein